MMNLMFCCIFLILSTLSCALANPQSFAGASSGAGPNYGYDPQRTIALGLSAVNGLPPGLMFPGGNGAFAGAGNGGAPFYPGGNLASDYIPPNGNGVFVSSSSNGGGGGNGGGSVVSVNGHTVFYDANGNVVGGDAGGAPIGGGLASDPVNGGGATVFSSGGGPGSSGVAVVNNNGRVNGVVYGPNGAIRRFGNQGVPPQQAGSFDNGQSAAAANSAAGGGGAGNGPLAGFSNEQAPPPGDSGLANDAVNTAGGKRTNDNGSSFSSSSSSSDSSGRKRVSTSTRGKNAAASGSASSNSQ